MQHHTGHSTSPMSHSRTALVAAICCGGFAASATLPQFGNHDAATQGSRIVVPPTPAVTFDFSAMETAMARIAVDADGNPRLVSATEAALLEAFAILPKAAPQAIHALIRDSFPGTGEDDL